MYRSAFDGAREAGATARARKRLNLPIAALLTTTALNAPPALLLHSVFLIAGLAVGILPAVAEGGSTGVPGGIDNPTGPGDAGTDRIDDHFFDAGSGGGAGYQSCGDGGVGELDRKTLSEAGLDLAVAANTSLGISWTGQFASQRHDNTVKGNFVWRF